MTDAEFILFLVACGVGGWTFGIVIALKFLVMPDIRRRLSALERRDGAGEKEGE
jgi:hypothetical protein